MRQGVLFVLLLLAACGRYASTPEADAGIFEAADAVAVMRDSASLKSDATSIDAGLGASDAQTLDARPADAESTNLCTESTGLAVQVQVQNNSSSIVRLVWRHHPSDGGPSCEELFQINIAPNSAISESTYVNHVFAAYRVDDGTLVKAFAVSGPGTVNLP
jgi:hypothetical protein